MKPTLYVESSLKVALDKKLEKGCPHIHLSVESDCDAFTASLIWIEVLDRGLKSALNHGGCVVSFEQKSKNHILTKEEYKIISNMEKALSGLIEKVLVIRNESK